MTMGIVGFLAAPEMTIEGFWGYSLIRRVEPARMNPFGRRFSVPGFKVVLHIGWVYTVDMTNSFSDEIGVGGYSCFNFFFGVLHLHKSGINFMETIPGLPAEKPNRTARFSTYGFRVVYGPGFFPYPVTTLLPACSVFRQTICNPDPIDSLDPDR
jgi:hypothetical protein